jgi:hypothetical protein
MMGLPVTPRRTSGLRSALLFPFRLPIWVDAEGPQLEPVQTLADDGADHTHGVRRVAATAAS